VPGCGAALRASTCDDRVFPGSRRLSDPMTLRRGQEVELRPVTPVMRRHEIVQPIVVVACPGNEVVYCTTLGS
jgi:hypothetical protein